MNKQIDILIIGGGPAGLSAALATGRMGRTALVCDDGRPRNQASDHLNNFPTRDGIHPAKWREAARADIQKYSTIEFFNDSVKILQKNGEKFTAQLADETSVDCFKVILAYGIQDRLPDIAGLTDLWGKSVFHCPYCHGYEVRGKALGIIADDDFAMHMVPMIYGLSHDLVLFTNGKSSLSEQQKISISKKVKIVETPIQSLAYSGDQLSEVVLRSGERVKREALYLAPTMPFQTKSNLGKSLGCKKTEHGRYEISPMGETSITGVFAAGDNAVMAQSVAYAVASGGLAAAGAINQLLSQEFF